MSVGEVSASPRSEAVSRLGPQGAWDRGSRGPPAGRRDVPRPAQCPSLELWACLRLTETLTLITHAFQHVR